MGLASLTNGRDQTRTFGFFWIKISNKNAHIKILLTTFESFSSQNLICCKLGLEKQVDA